MTTNDATLVELNERYKDKPVSEATYEIDGQLFTVTSHYVGEKSLDKELYDYSPRKIPPIHSRIPVVRGSVPGVRDRIPLTYISSILSPRERYLTFTACTSRIFSLPA